MLAPALPLLTHPTTAWLSAVRQCIWVIIFFGFWVGNSQGQAAANAKLAVTHYGVEDGLSQGSVYSMLKDSRGFMWFTSYEGLNRFDGHEFKVYRPSNSEKFSIQGSNTIGLVEDPYGDIWVGSEACMNRYIRKRDGFEQVYATASDGTAVRSANYPFFADSSQVWYLNSVEGLLTYNFQTGEKKIRARALPYQRSEFIFNPTVCFSPRDIWVRLSIGLVHFDGQTGKLKYYFSNHERNVLGPPVQTTCLYGDHRGVLWFGDELHQLFSFDPASGQWEKWNFPSTIESPILDVGEISSGQLVLGTSEHGLFFLNEKIEIFKTMNASQREPPGTTNNNAAKIYVDDQGIIWISDDPEGIDKIAPDSKPFQRFDRTNLFESELTKSAGVRCFAERQDHKIWIGTQEDGLMLFDPVEEKVLRKIMYQASFPSNHASALLIDQQQRLWVGTYNGLYLMDEEGNGIRKVEIDHRQDWRDASEVIRHLLLAPDGNVIFSTAAGVYFVEPGSLEVQSLDTLRNADSERLWLDSEGHLFVPEDNNGFYVLSYDDWIAKRNKTPIGKRFIRHFLPDVNVKYFYQNPTGGPVWVSTNLGLMKIFPQKNWTAIDSVKHFATDDGLPSNLVYGTLPAAADQLWMSTNQGLSCFDPATERFVNYAPQDGLQGSEFNTNSLLLAANGEMYFGGTQGFNRFLPSEILALDAPPDGVQIVGFNINEKPWEGSAYIGELDGIELAAGQNTFTLHYAAIDYLSDGNNQYQVMLIGFDPDWLPLGTQRQVRYTQVPPGKYTFAVKAANRDGVWMEKARLLNIRVLPPWYRTWWAYLGYLALAGLVIFQIKKFRSRRRTLRRQLEMEHFEADRLRELDEVKNRFFTNITHEFRTPLTVISGMADQLHDRPDKPKTEEVEMIKRNSDNLLQLINQILDLSKLEAGALQANMVQGDVILYLKYLTESFHSLAEARQIELFFQSESAELMMDHDPEKLQQIVSNLLSNALKFTPAGGEVTVTVGGAADIPNQLRKAGWPGLAITVTDTGIGISPKNLPAIFDRFYRIEDTSHATSEGTGIGLALTQELVKLLDGHISVQSAVGKGSTFTVVLPIKNETAPTSPAQPSSGKARSIQTGKIPLAAGNPLPATVLLIEDNVDLVKYLSVCLAGYTLEVANNGDEGIRKAIETVPDLIVSDVMMPGKDGFEVCHTLKNDERTSHVPIVLLTARADLDSRLEGLGRGADAYLTKPFHKKELLLRVRKLLELRRKLQAHYRSLATSDGRKTEENIEDAFVRRVRAVVEKHLPMAEFTVLGLSREVGMSRSQLHRKLTALTGLSPVQFIRHIRLAKAKILLHDASLNIADVAYETGFTAPNYFSRMFSKEFGMSPSEYREQR